MEIKEIKREPKKGEYIKIVNPAFSFDKRGDILKVGCCRDGLTIVYSLDYPHNRPGLETRKFWCYSIDDYVVLEGYHPQENK